jgi:tripartite-type tricarboxylate transporter receptor subunit TctC
MRYLKRFFAIAASALAFSHMAQAAQPAFPERPIRLIIGSAPGSGPDIIARLLADHLYKVWGQRVVVDARAGVGGVISAEHALKANPDGYTWLMLTSQLFVSTAVYRELRFNLDTDFDSVAMIGLVPWVLTVNPQLAAKSVAELVALAKKSPGTIRYGSGGPGSGEHFTTIMFTHLAGVDMFHVPYKGVAQALLEVIANAIQMQIAVLPAAKPHVDSGRLRGLGVSTAKRAPGLPDLPVIADTVPGYVNFGWYSIIAPRGTPATVLAKASEEIVKGVNDPAFGDRLKTLGIETTPGGRKELDEFRKSERKRVSEIVKVSGMSVSK